MANQSELAKRIRHAKTSNCLMEVVLLRFQYLDLWLRIFFENTPHQEKWQREFGRLLKQCLTHGFGKTLYDRIHRFNRHRVKAIHGYVVGVTTYQEIAAVVDESEGLSEVLAEFVLLNSGTIVTDEFENEHHSRGDVDYNVPVLLAQFHSRPSI
jgi:hypothetical protein